VACERSRHTKDARRSRGASVRISDFELRISRIAGWAFFAQRLARACHAKAKQRRINVAFDGEVSLPADLSAGTLAKAEASAQAGVGQNGFQSGQNVFKARPTW